MEEPRAHVKAENSPKRGEKNPTQGGKSPAQETTGWDKPAAVDISAHEADALLVKVFYVRACVRVRKT